MGGNAALEKEIPAVPAPAGETVAPVGGDAADSVDWDSLLAEDVDDAGEDLGSMVEAPVTEGEQKPTETAVAKAPEIAPTATPPATPVVEAAAPLAEVPPAPVVPQVEAPQVQAPVKTAEEQLALRENYIKEIAGQYVMSAEQEAQLISSPNQYLPQLAARLRVDIVDQVVPMIVRNLMENLPNLIDSHTTRKVEARTTEDSFFQKWGELKGHETTIQRIAQQWRQMNPKATRDEAIQEVGILAWRAAKLPLAGLVAKLSDAPVTPGQVVEEVTRMPAPRAPTGFAPAPTAVSTGGAPTGKSWQEELLSYDEDDS